MIFRNTASQGLYVFAYNKTTGAAQTGDSANITATWSKDGAAADATNDTNPTEIGGGVYWFDLTQAETNCNGFALVAVSATSNILIEPVIGYTTGGAIAAIRAKTDLIPASPAAVSDIPTTAEIADKVLGRNLAGGSDGGRTVTDALRPLRNKVTIIGTTMSVKQENDATEAWAAELTTNGSAQPITAIDPS